MMYKILKNLTLRGGAVKEEEEKRGYRDPYGRSVSDNG
jgi:hypothetical protein